MRARLTTSSLPSSAGTAPPTIEVLPPCGTSDTPAAAQIRTTSANSAGIGRTNHRRRAPLIKLPPILGVRRDIGRLGQQPPRPNGAMQRREQSLGHNGDMRHGDSSVTQPIAGVRQVNAGRLSPPWCRRPLQPIRDRQPQPRLRHRHRRDPGQPQPRPFRIQHPQAGEQIGGGFGEIA